MLVLREAQPHDSVLIVQYIKELAEFEKLTHECEANAALIEKWLFGDAPKAHCVLAEWEGKPAGFGVYFYNFSTFLSRPGIYVEDIFVRPEYRRKGIAKSMFCYLAKKAIAEECGRMEWAVLDWNTNAIDLYQSFGARSLNEWITQRVTGEALKRLAI